MAEEVKKIEEWDGQIAIFFKDNSCVTSQSVEAHLLFAIYELLKKKKR